MRRLRKLQNVADSIGYSIRMSRVLLAPFNLKMEIIPQQKKKPLKNYSGFRFRNNLGTFWRLEQS